MKTQNFYHVLVGILVILMTFASCENSTLIEESENDQLNIESTKIVLGKKEVVNLLTIYETADHVDHYPVNVGLSPSVYRIPKDHPKAQEYFDLIKNSKRAKEPLKILFETETQHIQKVEVVNQKEKEDWSKENDYLLNDFNSSDAMEVDLENTSGDRFSKAFSTKAQLDAAQAYMRSKQCDWSIWTNQWGCIPFGFKSDGCYARAHRMRQLLETVYGRTCYKMFVYSDYYNGKYLNIPGCSFGWTYHVAPLVYASNMSTWYVMDPSLNALPLTRNQWRGIMGNVCDTEYWNAVSYAPTNLGCGAHNVTTDHNYSSTYSKLWEYQNKFGCTSP